MTERQQSSVSNFFDKHSPNYRLKYNKEDEFYKYFFYSRLEKALNGIDTEGKTILDIGCGTGALYDYIIDNHVSYKNYYGCDISEGMLSQSKIPHENRYCGNVWDNNFNQVNFDVIYMLGVTTYLDNSTLEKHIDFIKNSLSDNGTAIITFTNKLCIDNLNRNLLKWPVSVLGGKERIVNQSFEKYLYSISEIKTKLDQDFSIIKNIWLNHTVFPFSRLFPSISVFIAEKIPEDFSLIEYLSSDFMLFLKKKV